MEWVGDACSGYLRLLDQTKLPSSITYLDCRTVRDVWQAIRQLSVRGAPAIGIAAAFGCVLGAQQGLDEFAEAITYLNSSRPTAVNLFWATARMAACADHATPDVNSTVALCSQLLAEAQLIHAEDRSACHQIGEHGLALLRKLTNDDLRLMTHCNAGALATGGIGTATAPMYAAHTQQLPLIVYANETRPLLQGSRLTSFELGSAGIDVRLITDSMAASVMRSDMIRAIITGADRIAANGDVANKIGTYALAVLANHHDIPFVVAAPSSTFDFDCPDGDAIPIEERASEEITQGFGKRTAPEGVQTYSPAFDVTPSSLITALITERGIVQPVGVERVREVVAPLPID